MTTATSPLVRWRELADHQGHPDSCEAESQIKSDRFRASGVIDSSSTIKSKDTREEIISPKGNPPPSDLALHYGH